MSNDEILRKAIERAVTNGYEGFASEAYSRGNGLHPRDISLLIFNHDFAKAFFAKEDEHGFHKDDAWKYYLQQMVLEENPLKYLEKFI